MRTFLFENYCLKVPRARSRLTTIFGRYYFVEMSEDEFKIKYYADEVISRIDHVKTRAQLCDFVKTLQQKPLDLYKGPAYHWYISEDFEDGGLICFVMNHGYCDGIQWIATLNAMAIDGF